jgi:hypothetical protein
MSFCCRLCGAQIDTAPIFSIEHAPCGAQLFSKERNAEFVSLQVVQCASCGLVQLSDVEPVPYYRTAITSAGLSDEMRLFRTGQFRRLCTEYDLSGRRVVEVGAANGVLVDLLGDAGMDAVGIEWGAAESGARTAKGHPFIRDYPSAGRSLLQAPYDGFVCINFIEHSPHPVDFLRGIARSVQAGGIGLVEVPAFEHMLEVNLSYDWVADHLSYFSKDTLKLVLEISGFEVLKIERVWHDFDWAATVRKRDPLKLDAMYSSYSIIKEAFVHKVRDWKLAGKKIAVWGASHQSLTLLADCRFTGNEIETIVDSAPFKQGTYAPGCSLPVVSPSWIETGKVDVVLIMAAGFSNEVGRILRTKIGYTGEAYIFRGAGEMVPV